MIDPASRRIGGLLPSCLMSRSGQGWGDLESAALSLSWAVTGRPRLRAQRPLVSYARRCRPSPRPARPSSPPVLEKEVGRRSGAAPDNDRRRSSWERTQRSGTAWTRPAPGLPSSARHLEREAAGAERGNPARPRAAGRGTAWRAVPGLFSPRSTRLPQRRLGDQVLWSSCRRLHLYVGVNGRLPTRTWPRPAGCSLR